MTSTATYLLAASAGVGALFGISALLLGGSGDKPTNPLLEKALAAYRLVFNPKGEELKEIVGATAPGRVNLIGEHTDYNDGFVCPMGIERCAFIVGRLNKLSRFRMIDIALLDQNKKPIVHEFSRAAMLRAPGKDEKPTWDAYVRGVVAQYVKMLKRTNPQATVPCFDCCIASDVPLGGGLSSSAALEMSTATFLDALMGMNTPLKTRALMCQKAEHEFAKVPCGIMDQFISALGKAGHALLLDCRSLETKEVKMTDPNITVLITNTHVKHALGSGEYAKRRKSCEAAVEVIKQRKPAVKALRDVTLEELKASESDINDDVVFRRARHVISENQRTLDFVAAMEASKYTEAGKLMYASHESLRADYEVSCKQLDILVEIARKCKGVYGARMTGGGFGGCTVTLVDSAYAEQVAKTLEAEYKKITNIDTKVLFTRASAGTSVVPKSRLAIALQIPIMAKL